MSIDPHAEEDAATPAQKRAAILRRLRVVAVTAVTRTEECLDGLGRRIEDEDRDRGALSAERLMRVAKSAIGLLDQMESTDSAHDRARPHPAFTEEDAGRFVAGFESQIERIARRHPGFDAAIHNGDDE